MFSVFPHQEPRWFPLLSSKYTKQKPALLVGVSLENDSKATEPSPDRFKARKAPPRQGRLLLQRWFLCFSLVSLSTTKTNKTSHQISGDHFHSCGCGTCWISSHYNFLPGSPAVTDLLPETLEAVLIPDQGYHQVGPSDLCSDMFILSVTIAFASKLEQVWYLYIYIFLIITQLPTIIVLEIKKKGFEIM